MSLFTHPVPPRSPRPRQRHAGRAQRAHARERAGGWRAHPPHLPGTLPGWGWGCRAVCCRWPQPRPLAGARMHASYCVSIRDACPLHDHSRIHPAIPCLLAPPVTSCSLHHAIARPPARTCRRSSTRGSRSWTPPPSSPTTTCAPPSRTGVGPVAGAAAAAAAAAVAAAAAAGILTRCAVQASNLAMLPLFWLRPSVPSVWQRRHQGLAADPGGALRAAGPSRHRTPASSRAAGARVDPRERTGSCLLQLAVCSLLPAMPPQLPIHTLPCPVHNLTPRGPIAVQGLCALGAAAHRQPVRAARGQALPDPGGEWQPGGDYHVWGVGVRAGRRPK